MLQDMRHSCVVVWISLEPNCEDIVLVLPGNVNVVRSGPVVLQLNSGELHLRKMPRPLHRESMDFIAWSRDPWKVGQAGGKGPSPYLSEKCRPPNSPSAEQKTSS